MMHFHSSLLVLNLLVFVFLSCLAVERSPSGRSSSSSSSSSSSLSSLSLDSSNGHEKDFVEEYEEEVSRGKRELSVGKPHAAHKRPLRLGKKNRHNNKHLRDEHHKHLDEKKGEGRYKDLLDQDVELDPSYMIRDPMLDRLNDSYPPSIISFNNVTEKGKFSILSMAIDHHYDTQWMVPSFHIKYSAGWNRTMELDHNMRPYSCHVRFYAIGERGGVRIPSLFVTFC
jgi:hypothetical protein